MHPTDYKQWTPADVAQWCSTKLCARFPGVSFVEILSSIEKLHLIDGHLLLQLDNSEWKEAVPSIGARKTLMSALRTLTRSPLEHADLVRFDSVLRVESEWNDDARSVACSELSEPPGDFPINPTRLSPRKPEQSRRRSTGSCDAPSGVDTHRRRRSTLSRSSSCDPRDETSPVVEDAEACASSKHKPKYDLRRLKVPPGVIRQHSDDLAIQHRRPRRGSLGPTIVLGVPERNAEDGPRDVSSGSVVKSEVCTESFRRSGTDIGARGSRSGLSRNSPATSPRTPASGRVQDSAASFLLRRMTSIASFRAANHGLPGGNGIPQRWRSFRGTSAQAGGRISPPHPSAADQFDSVSGGECNAAEMGTMRQTEWPPPQVESPASSFRHRVKFAEPGTGPPDSPQAQCSALLSSSSSAHRVIDVLSSKKHDVSSMSQSTLYRSSHALKPQSAKVPEGLALFQWLRRLYLEKSSFSNLPVADCHYSSKSSVIPTEASITCFQWLSISTVYALCKFYVFLQTVCRYLTVMQVTWSAACCLCTWLCNRYNITADIPFTMHISLLIFPLAFSVNAGYSARAGALMHAAEFKASCLSLYLNHRCFQFEKQVPLDFLTCSCDAFTSLFKAVREYLTTRSEADKLHNMQLVYDSFSEISLVNDVLRIADMPAPLVAGMTNNIRSMIVSFECLRQFSDYRTPSSVRAFVLLGVTLTPAFLIPSWAGLAAKTPGCEWIVYLYSFMMPLFLLFLLNAERSLEFPFSGVDGIRTDALHMVEYMTDVELIESTNPGRNCKLDSSSESSDEPVVGIAMVHDDD